ncbi:ArsR family transcriptional regulator [candidate division GN15 bacterium]|uniref:ArsR family transcriptional regulator n=1 Tax=candidate division GN15 bacterium TaxID=2072418 RepID=A0A855X4M8_9BACT|nr:MAG: ArsR family transcriptional regulator [candidate division GN15 bacterium]
MKAKNANDFSRVPDPMIELVAGCFHALSDPTRLKILRALKNGRLTVHELVDLFTWTQPNISRHLAILVQAGLVKKAKEGFFVYYSVANPKIFSLCDTVCTHVSGTLEGYSRPRS